MGTRRRLLYCIGRGRACGHVLDRTRRDRFYLLGGARKRPREVRAAARPNGQQQHSARQSTEAPVGSNHFSLVFSYMLQQWSDAALSLRCAGDLGSKPGLRLKGSAKPEPLKVKLMVMPILAFHTKSCLEKSTHTASREASSDAKNTLASGITHHPRRGLASPCPRLSHIKAYSQLCTWLVSAISPRRKLPYNDKTDTGQQRISRRAAARTSHGRASNEWRCVITYRPPRGRSRKSIGLLSGRRSSRRRRQRHTRLSPPSVCVALHNAATPRAVCVTRLDVVRPQSPRRRAPSLAQSKRPVVTASWRKPQ